MSKYRRDASDEVAEGIGCLFFALFAALAAGIYATHQASKVPPQEELQKLKHPSYWGQCPELQICSTCSAPNNTEGTVCTICGQTFGTIEDEEPVQKGLFIASISIFLCIVIFLIVMDIWYW